MKGSKKEDKREEGIKTDTLEFLLPIFSEQNIAKTEVRNGKIHIYSCFEKGCQMEASSPRDKTEW